MSWILILGTVGFAAAFPEAAGALLVLVTLMMLQMTNLIILFLLGHVSFVLVLVLVGIGLVLLKLEDLPAVRDGVARASDRINFWLEKGATIWHKHTTKK